MAVDLGDLVESLRREVSQPGAEFTTYPGASNTSFTGHLRDSFWELWIESGLLAGYTEAEGLVTPTTEGGEDLDRGLQQLIVIYAGIRILRNQIMATNTVFRAKAGPVEYETQKSASAAKAILDSLIERRNYILTTLSEQGAVADYYIDAVMERDDGFDAWWG